MWRVVYHSSGCWKSIPKYLLETYAFCKCSHFAQFAEARTELVSWDDFTASFHGWGHFSFLLALCRSFSQRPNCQSWHYLNTEYLAQKLFSLPIHTTTQHCFFSMILFKCMIPDIDTYTFKAYNNTNWK